MATYLGHQEDSSGNILLPTPHSMAAQIELGTTASQAYAKGAYVVFNNRLCKASAAIASGDTLAIGTNLSQCSIGSELSSHLQANDGKEFYFDYKDGKPGFYPSASKDASEFVPFGGSSAAQGGGVSNTNVKNAVRLVSYGGSLGSRTTVSRTANFTTTGPCVVLGAGYGAYSHTLSLSVGDQSVSIAGTNQVPAVAMILLPDAGSYTLNMSINGVDATGMIGGYKQLS